MKTLLVGILLVHSWYPIECCTDKDCRPVPCEQIEKLGDGFVWLEHSTKQKHYFPKNRLQPSQDDVCHVCVSPKTWPSGICLFVPWAI